MSCSRITGICTVANDAQYGHSKSEYSVTSTEAASAPSEKPRKPSVAGRRGSALAAGAVARGPPSGSPAPLRPETWICSSPHPPPSPLVAPPRGPPPPPPAPLSDYPPPRCPPRGLCTARLPLLHCCAVAPRPRAFQHER